MVQNGPLLSVPLTHSLSWWTLSIAGLLRCLSTEGRKQGPIVPVSLLHLPKQMGEGEGRLLGSEGESADFQSEFRTRWSKEGESHEATGWVLKKSDRLGKCILSSRPNTKLILQQRLKRSYLNVSNYWKIRFFKFSVSFVFLWPYVQLITIHIACNKMQVWSNGN